MEPETFIRHIRETFGIYPTHSGGCRKFAKILNGIYNAELYYNGDHFISKINGRFYDIYGSYAPDDFVTILYEGEIRQTPVSDFIPEKCFGENHLSSSFCSV